MAENPTLNLSLTILRAIIDDQNRTIPIGTQVEYRAHVPGGMVKIFWKGRESVIHPAATKELR